MASSRKRSRDDLDEDGDESLPISKRINGLHIQNERKSQNEKESLSACILQNHMNGHESTWQHQASQQINGHARLSPLSSNQPLQLQTNSNNNISSCEAQPSSSSSAAIVDPDLQGYDPELSATENPHYFHINEVLYRANVDRATRKNNFFNNG